MYQILFSLVIVFCLNACTAPDFDSVPEAKTKKTQMEKKPIAIDPSKDAYPYTGLCDQAISANLEGVKEAIKKGIDINGQCGPAWDTALHIAAYAGKNGAIVRTLIDAGADVNSTNRYQVTPLQNAIAQSENPATRGPAHANIIKMLRSAGAK